MTAPELAAVKRFMARNNVVAQNVGPLQCPFYAGRCTIYPVRPFICKAFGHSERLPCSRGYNVNVPDAKIAKAVRANGRAVALLHSLITSAAPDASRSALVAEAGAALPAADTAEASGSAPSERE